MGGAISAISKVVEKAKDVMEGVKSAFSHGAKGLECLMKGDIPGAMQQMQAGMMDCMKSTQAAMTPGLTFKSQGSQMGNMGFNPWSMLGGGGNQPFPMPPMGMMGMGGGMQQMGMGGGMPMMGMGGGMPTMGMGGGMPMMQPMGMQTMQQPMMQPMMGGGMPIDMAAQQRNMMAAGNQMMQPMGGYGGGAQNFMSPQQPMGNYGGGGNPFGQGGQAGQVDGALKNGMTQDMQSSHARNEEGLNQQAAATKEAMHTRSQTNAMTQALTIQEAFLKFLTKAADGMKDNAPK